MFWKLKKKLDLKFKTQGGIKYELIWTFHDNFCTWLATPTFFLRVYQFEIILKQEYDYFYFSMHRVTSPIYNFRILNDTFPYKGVFRFHCCQEKNRVRFLCQILSQFSNHSDNFFWRYLLVNLKISCSKLHVYLANLDKFWQVSALS